MAEPKLVAAEARRWLNDVMRHTDPGTHYTQKVMREAARRIHALASIADTCASMDPAAEKERLERITAQPVAWRVRGYSQFKTGKPGPWRYFDGPTQPRVNDPDCCDFEPLFGGLWRERK